MDQSGNSIRDYVLECLWGFTALRDTLQSQEGPTGVANLPDLTATALTPSQVESEEVRFKVWCGNIGAHQTGTRSSLDYRLRDASHIRKQVVKILASLSGSLVDARLLLVGEIPPLEDEVPDFQDDDDLPGLEDLGYESELVQIFTNVIDSTTRLMRLSITIRNPAPHDRFLRAKATSTRHNEPWDVQYASDKFPQADPELAERLGKALSQRRQYFKYRESHHGRLGHGLGQIGQGEEPGELGDDDDTEAQTVFSTVASSLPFHLRSPADGRAEKEPAVLDEDETSETDVSQTSFATSTSTPDTLKIPKLPKEASDGPFGCQFCYMIISAPNSRAWKRHVHADLQPYICLWKDCSTPHQQFQRRSHWLNHILQCHWRSWYCALGCSQEFSERASIRSHILDAHSGAALSTSLDTLSGLGEKPRPLNQEITCPLCRVELPSITEYAKHVGRHLVDIALFALPSGKADDEEMNDKETPESNSNSDSDSNNEPLDHIEEHRNNDEGSARDVYLSQPEDTGRDSGISSYPPLSRKELDNLYESVRGIDVDDRETTAQRQARREKLPRGDRDYRGRPISQFSPRDRRNEYPSDARRSSRVLSDALGDVGSPAASPPGPEVLHAQPASSSRLRDPELEALPPNTLATAIEAPQQEAAQESDSVLLHHRFISSASIADHGRDTDHLKDVGFKNRPWDSNELRGRREDIYKTDMNREGRQNHGQNNPEYIRDDSSSRSYYYPSRGRSPPSPMPPSPLESIDAPPLGRQEFADVQQPNVQGPAEDDLMIRTVENSRKQYCHLPLDRLLRIVLARIRGEQLIALPHMCPEGNECYRFKDLKTIVAHINPEEREELKLDPFKGLKLDPSKPRMAYTFHRPGSPSADGSGADTNQPGLEGNTETQRSHTLLDMSKPQLISLISYTEDVPGPLLDFNTVQRIWRPGSSPIRIGRYRDDVQPLNDPLIQDRIGFKSRVVSRRHCEVLIQDGKWYIRDVGSSSGTFLNHNRISAPNENSDLVALHSGDILQLGINFRGGEEEMFRCVRMKIHYETVEESFTTEDLVHQP